MSAIFLPVFAAPTSLVHANSKWAKACPNQWEMRRKLSAPFLPVNAALTSHVVRANANANRQFADFSPSQWGDLFLNVDPHMTMKLDSEKNQIDELKDEVKMMVAATKPLEKLHLIDQIQRMGLAYNFEKEIDEYMEQIKNLYFEHEESGSSLDHLDLHTTALLFRLLRQQGYRISPDMFQKLKDGSTASFKDSTADIRGLLSLYEASHLRVHGEDVLEEAFAFSRGRLERFVEEYNENNVRTEAHSLAAQVGHALEQCLWKGIARTEARFYISVYEEEKGHSIELLTLAKLDFNFLQKQHLNEINSLSRWWKELDISRKLPFARDRLVETYHWTLATYFEPQYALARDIFAKFFTFFTTLDDIYDAYGTFEELQLFTDAIERWDIKMMDRLPDYMQVFYKELLHFFDEIKQQLVHTEGLSSGMYYAKESVKLQARAYLKEAEWLNQKKIPTLEEYLFVSLTSVGIAMLMAISFLGMGDITTEHAYKWILSSQNETVKASSLICRLTNDIAGHKFEQGRDHVASAVQCFMKQHGVTEQAAVEELWKKVDDGWKDLNEECFQPRPVPTQVLTRILNITRSLSLFYKDDTDVYTHSDLKMKQQVAELLVDPIPM